MIDAAFYAAVGTFNLWLAASAFNERRYGWFAVSFVASVLAIASAVKARLA